MSGMKLDSAIQAIASSASQRCADGLPQSTESVWKSHPRTPSIGDHLEEERLGVNPRSFHCKPCSRFHGGQRSCPRGGIKGGISRDHDSVIGHADD